MNSKSLVDQSLEVLNKLSELQSPKWEVPITGKIYEKMNSLCSNITLKDSFNDCGPANNPVTTGMRMVNTEREQSC